MKKNSKNNKSNIILNILIFICIIVFIVSFLMFLNSLKDIKDNKDEYKELSNLVETKESEASDETNSNESYDFSKLKEINSECVGWINIPNTSINFPVLQTDNNEFYLKHDFNKKNNFRGSIYMDYRNDSVNFQRNTIIYGHNCYDGTIFSDLDKYYSVKFYKKAPTFEYTNENGKKNYKIYAVFITNANGNEDNGNVFYYNTPNPNSDFGGFIKEINKRRLYKTNVDIRSDDKIMTLSTCTRKMDIYKNGKRTYKADSRIAIIGREVREGESLYVDVEKTTINDNPKYPQIWYDKYGKQNPYINDKTWYIGEANNAK